MKNSGFHVMPNTKIGTDLLSTNSKSDDSSSSRKKNNILQVDDRWDEYRSVAAAFQYPAAATVRRDYSYSCRIDSLLLTLEMCWNSDQKEGVLRYTWKLSILVRITENETWRLMRNVVHDYSIMLCFGDSLSVRHGAVVSYSFFEQRYFLYSSVVHVQLSWQAWKPNS